MSASPSEQSSKKTKLSDPDEPIFHAFHCDPTADITIASDDGMHFRVSSYRLGQASTLLAQMFTLPSTEKKKDEDIIHLDYTNPVIEAFLDLVTFKSRGTPIKLAIRDALAFTRLCQVFEVEKRISDAASQIQATAERAEGFELLVIASETNDLEMAKKALNTTSTDQATDGRYLLVTPTDPSEILWANISRLPMNWRDALFRTLFSSYRSFPGWWNGAAGLYHPLPIPEVAARSQQ